ncbi:hypothetical protein ID866_5643 [Astraeus odoratus]|nr:hypothetical protein ID866_5643 [Astraeus odoratus]
MEEQPEAASERAHLRDLLSRRGAPDGSTEEEEEDPRLQTPLARHLLHGLAYTVGSALGCDPPTREECLAAFVAPNRVGLTAGARAWSKHGHRSQGHAPSSDISAEDAEAQSGGWWGTPSGPVAGINERALLLFERVVDHATWRNLHWLPHQVLVYEARVEEGYGMRWSQDRSGVQTAPPRPPLTAHPERLFTASLISALPKVHVEAALSRPGTDTRSNSQMSTSSTQSHRRRGRYAHAEAILGPELCARLAQTRVLLVGAGGIGCELLKNVVMTGFGHITLLDLDTIDLSNLNRQFLFRKKDIKQSKAMVAAHTAGAFNPNVHIQPIHANIKEPQFDIEWFRGFDIVLNALDNLDARRHVNKMCMAAGIPLVESGTAGYLGQVQPLLKVRFEFPKGECFDCVPKPTPKTFPVCTIRSTPSLPIHCIVWAKSYLLPQLFGEDENGGAELDEAEKQGENAQEIAALRKEALAYKAVRNSLRSAATTDDAAKTVFRKVFHNDILNLLSMSDMWRSRAAPTPLDFDAIEKGTFVVKEPIKSTVGVNGSSSSKPQINGYVNGSATTSTPASKTNGTNGGLKDQRALSLQDNLALFVSSTKRLAVRLRGGEGTISFDKDDDDTLDFVTAASNLRSAAYYIERKTRWEVKEIAGNIIPAIATTNAIIAGLIVLQALHLLRKSYSALKTVHLQFKPTVPISTVNLCPPNQKCGICRDTYTTVLCDPTKTTLGEVVDGILGNGDAESGGTGKRDVSVYEDKRILSDPDWDDNLDRTLDSLNVTRGKFLTIVDDEGEWGTIAVALSVLPANHPANGPSLVLPSPLPKPPYTPHFSTPTSAPSRKRSAPDDDDDGIVELGPLTKRPKTNGTGSTSELGSPSKKRRLEEDGLVMLSNATDKMDDDVIEID